MPLTLIALVKAAIPVLVGIVGADTVGKSTAPKRPGVPGGTPGVPPAPDLPDPGGIIRRDSAYVRWFQSGLTALGFSTRGVDGVIGPNTRAAVSAFQGRNGLLVDGAVGRQTEAALIAALRAANAPNPTPPPMR